MSVVITNVTDGGFADDDGMADYIVRINAGPILARYRHRRSDGLAECLRRAAEALDEPVAGRLVQSERQKAAAAQADGRKGENAGALTRNAPLVFVLFVLLILANY